MNNCLVVVGLIAFTAIEASPLFNPGAMMQPGAMVGSGAIMQTLNQPPGTLQTVNQPIATLPRNPVFNLAALSSSCGANPNTSAYTEQKDGVSFAISHASNTGGGPTSSSASINNTA